MNLLLIPSRRQLPRLALLGASALVAGVLISGCSRPEPTPEPVRAVKVMTVGLSTLESGHEFAGEVRARVESRLGFRVAGKLTVRAVEVGQRVQAGQLLAQLDPQDYRLAADAARAQVMAAQTQRDLAAADYRRFKDLKDQHFISGAELDRRDAALKAAQAQLEQAQAQLSAQGNQAAYTRLVADAAGVVTAVDAEVGQVVAPGTPVVRVAVDGPRDVLFAVPEDQLGQWHIGQASPARAWASSAVYTGRVREVAASADPVTRTFGIKLALQGLDMPALGSTVYVAHPRLEAAAAPVIKLPTSALRQQGQGSAVWVLDTASMQVRSVPVQVATADGNDAVIASGLQPGQQVVVAGVHVLSPDQKVSIFMEKQAQVTVQRSFDATDSVATTATAKK